MVQVSPMILVLWMYLILSRWNTVIQSLSCEDMHPEPVSSDSESDFCFDDEVRLCNI